jgi:EAL domain-containing protein (putative c-di-GMP-specific phosphodiesterase class I)
VIIELARSLNLELIAEGVETESEVNKMAQLGVQIMQGFYFEKPLEHNKMAELLLANKKYS